DEHLAWNAVLLEHPHRGRHALLNRLRLVQAGDDDGDVDRALRSGALGACRRGETLGGRRHDRKDYVLPFSPAAEHNEPLQRSHAVRVCLVYDLFSPFTIGGAERWYRDLGDRLAAQGHSVTYLTLRHWPRGEHPELPGIEVRAVGPRFRMHAHGRRRILPPLVFGLGVLAHLLRDGRRYDVVHTCSFPYFSVLAAAATRRLHGFRLFVDWFGVWTRESWREYLGPAGVLGWLVQRRCIHVKQRAFCFSSLFERRLRDEGFRGEITRLSGLYGGSLEAPHPRPPEDVVVFAGRHIPEKRVPAIPPAVARARERVPSLRAELYGDGPDRDKVLRLVRELGLEGVVEAPGFVEAERVEDALARAL